MEAYNELFHAVKRAYDTGNARLPELICKAGFYGGCPVLKLQKAAWTNDDMGMVPNQTGIFFSIWIDEESIKNQRVKYNIHALKLRHLKAYKITSIDFAKEFRRHFSLIETDWPNVSVDFGPLTLMQGWIPQAEKSLERDLLRLMKRFAKISPVIDEMLTTRARVLKV